MSSRRTDAPRAAEAESAPHDPNGDGSPSPHLPDNEPGQEDSRDAGNGWGSARGSRRGRGGASRSGYGATEDDETRGARRRGGRGRARPDGTASETGESGLPGGGTDAQAKEVCLRLLTDRARSRAELADKLAAKGFSTAVADRALDRLTEVGLIDDQAFAEQWVHSRHTFSGKGKKALAQELRRKGVAQEHAEEALSRISAEDEDERAADLVQRKLRSLPRDLDREKAIRRLVGMLARRGYNQSTAFTVVKNALADRDLGDLDEPGSL
ncbi:recombination regulator RecX [Nocardia acididurans]|uniref:recombination regulator RecX n=1 Tax=Nocardia acididurans TaxID=2802282 RepID=UPI00355773AD